MRISDTAIQDFIEIYHEKYGVLLNIEVATEIATRFLKLIEIVESRKK